MEVSPACISRDWRTLGKPLRTGRALKPVGAGGIAADGASFGGAALEVVFDLSAAAAMAQQIADATFSTIEDSGHGVMAEQPERTHRVLRQALVGSL